MNDWCIEAQRWDVITCAALPLLRIVAKFFVDFQGSSLQCYSDLVPKGLIGRGNFGLPLPRMRDNIADRSRASLSFSFPSWKLPHAPGSSPLGSGDFDPQADRRIFSILVQQPSFHAAICNQVGEVHDCEIVIIYGYRYPSSWECPHWSMPICGGKAAERRCCISLIKHHLILEDESEMKEDGWSQKRVSHGDRTWTSIWSRDPGKVVQ